MIPALVLLLAAAEGGAASPTEPAARLVFEEVLLDEPEEGTKGRDGAPLPPRKKEGRLELWLGARSFATADGAERALHDFDKARIHRWTEGGPGSESSTFYAVLDGALKEYEHRRKMAELIGIVDKKVRGFGPLELETLFGVESDGGKVRADIAVKESGGDRVFTAGAEPLSSFAVECRPLPPGLQASWNRFLRHEARIHPAVREAVGKDAGVPVRMEFRWWNATIRHVRTLKLVLVEDAAGKFPVPPAPRAPGKDPLERALAGARAAEPPSREAAVAASKERLEAGDPVDAFLCLLAHSFATGDRMSAEVRSVLGDPKAKEPVAELLSHMDGPGSPEEMIADVDWLLARKGKGGRNDVLYDLFAAGLLSKAGEKHSARARDLLLAVVEGRPDLTGAWHDLGFVYRERFEVDLAWRCWEAAIRLAPDHAILGDVHGIGRDLEKKHPDFFR